MENRPNQTPTPWAEQFSMLKRNNQINRNKPIYKNPQPQGYYAGDIVLEALKGFGQGISAIPKREIDIISQIPDRLLSFGRSIYNLTTGYDRVMNSPQDYENMDPISTKQSTLENAINFWKQYQIDTRKKLSDINKHQHMSCLAGKDGLILGLGGLAIGAGKEMVDIVQKLSNEQKKQAYGGRDGVLRDSFKDMNNNIKGFIHGFVDDQPCYPLLRNPLP